MQELANKLRMLYGNPFAGSQLPTAIFGSLANVGYFLELNRQRVRVGVWPVRSASPEIALGLAAVLAFLLENRREVEVYRLFAQLDGTPQDYQWTPQKSQFEVDDWQLEALGENVAVWGELDKTTEGWSLHLHAENDMSDDDEPREFTHNAATLSALITALPRIAEEISAYLEAGDPRVFAVTYGDVTGDDASLETLLKHLCHWEVKLLLALWGQTWAEDVVKTAQQGLLQASQAVGGTFGAWAVAKATARAMLPGFDPIGETLVETVSDTIDAFADSSIPSILLALALFRLDYRQEAYDLLDSAADDHADDVTVWLTLAELYLSSRQLRDVILTFQRAIEAKAVNTALFMRYAEILLLLAAENSPLNDYILINPEEYEENLPEREAIEAYEEVLKLDPENQEALYQQVLQMADLMDERFWEKFERLVKIDKTGENVRAVVDSLYNFDDLSEAIKILRAADSQRPDVHVNLAVLYLLDEQGEKARAELEKARDLTEDEEARADIDRLLLSADDLDFEQYLGELTDIANAGNELEVEDVEYLEEIVEKAPRFGELYLLLAKAYLLWDEPSTALETLLDGQKKLPNDPDILELLSRVLWESGERQLALEYLKKGLDAAPNHVPLLTRMGRCLFDEEQLDKAKTYLLKAESISPAHPALRETRQYISRMIEQEDES